MDILDLAVSDSLAVMMPVNQKHRIWNALTTVGLAVSYFRMDIERVSRPQNRTTFWQFDWLGIILLTVGLTIL